MEMRKLLDPEDIFHPEVFYDGEWLLGGGFSLDAYKKDYLLLNAKTKNGKNAYQQFLEENYYKPMAQLMNSRSIARPFFPKIALGVDATGEKRAVGFSISFFIYQQLAGLLDVQGAMERFSECVQENSTVTDWLNSLKKELRDDRSKYNDVRSHGRKSPHFEDVYQIYLEYSRISKTMVPFSDFLDKKISASTELLVATRYYPDFFAREINIEALVEAFDYDKFLLIAARSALDTCELTEERSDLVDNSAGYVNLYLESVDKVRSKNPSYNASMVMIDNHTGEQKRITIDDIRDEYSALLARHPEFDFIKTTPEEISVLLKAKGLVDQEIANFDISLRSNQELILELLQKLKADRELAVSWTILPKGKAASTSTIGVSLTQTSVLPENEKIRRMVIGRDYLENSAYLYRLSGMNKFEGYLAYLYANGSVIFEKYYENIRTKKVASSAATYVMNLYNFLELSKLSKTEIIRLLQTDATTKVRRIFHREDMDAWKRDIKRVITGADYSQEVKSYIETLISKENVKKIGGKV